MKESLIWTEKTQCCRIDILPGNKFGSSSVLAKAKIRLCTANPWNIRYNSICHRTFQWKGGMAKYSSRPRILRTWWAPGGVNYSYQSHLYFEATSLWLFTTQPVPIVGRNLFICLSVRHFIVKKSCDNISTGYETFLRYLFVLRLRSINYRVVIMPNPEK